MHIPMHILTHIRGAGRVRAAVKALFNRPEEEGRVSFAQDGEDVILASFFENRQRPGFYVDVGAYHPRRFSNTYFFYLRGWRGINIEPRPGSRRQFDKLRPRDLNLELGVSDVPGTLNYHCFDEPALNSFDASLSEERIATTPYRRVDQCKVPVVPLCDVFRQHLPAGQVIDFLSVDVEGHDLQVLRSNDWETYRPHFVVAEELVVGDLSGLAGCPISQFLRQQDYYPVAKTKRSLFFTCNRPEKH